jgi:hypothetical protein
MHPDASAGWLLEQEARALLQRISRIKSFALQETMVPAAALSVEAQAAVERHLARTIYRLKSRIREFLTWIESPEGQRAPPHLCQRRFTLLRLRFNAVLSHIDIFGEAISQRSEADTGVWLGGLDVVCRDALALPGLIEPPPIVCYLARGPGAAIRRARTRLPGGGENPIAIVRVPRERMISSGLASSLIHEVGHQGAALLGLVASLQHEMRRPPPPGVTLRAWGLLSRWISEIVADFWSIARLGITSTAGLLGVVSLPAAFVFRITANDPHPTPYVRVKLSAAIGQALYPDPQWRRMTELWSSLYPITGLDGERRGLFAELEESFPAFVRVLIRHRPSALRGRTLGQALSSPRCRPECLSALHEQRGGSVSKLGSLPPSLAFAVIGQARSDGVITPEYEADMLTALLRHWAWRSTVDASEVCAHTRSLEARFPAAAVR